MSDDQRWRRGSARHAEVETTEQFDLPPLMDDLADPDQPPVDEPDDELGDPFADDLDEQLAARAPRRWFNRATLVLAGLALLAVGFLGGAQVQKHFGAVPTSNAAAQNSGFPGGAAFGRGGQSANGGGGQAAAGNTRTGTVKLV